MIQAEKAGLGKEGRRQQLTMTRRVGAREEVTIQACLNMDPGFLPHRVWHARQAFELRLEWTGTTLGRQIEGYLGMIGTSTGGAAWEETGLHG
jgi:hypothetical protein